jgi:hypothetical protein
MEAIVRIRIGIALLLLLAACQSEVLAPLPVATQVSDELGLAYRGAATLSQDGALTANIIVTNERSTAVDLRVASHCAVLIRAWRSADYSGRPAWDQTAETRACSTLTRTIRLAPGEARVFAGEARPDLERGRYFLSVVLRREHRTIEVAAGHVDIP